jgi:hypothetical protein
VREVGHESDLVLTIQAFQHLVSARDQPTALKRLV